MEIKNNLKDLENKVLKLEQEKIQVEKSYKLPFEHKETLENLLKEKIELEKEFENENKTCVQFEDDNIKEEKNLENKILWKKENSYIILSGHNRVEALKMLGYEKLDKTMYKIKENISLEDARLILVDTNLVQRKDILPSERAKAYKIWKQVLEQKQAKRSENFVFENSFNTGEIAKQESLGHNVLEEKRRNINRYLRLNYLIKNLLNKVDEKELNLVMAVELSYLKEDVQNIVFDYFFIQNKSSLSIDICKKIREQAKKIEIKEETLSLIIESVEKKKTPRTFKLNFKDIREISNRTFTTDKEELLQQIKKQKIMY